MEGSEAGGIQRLGEARDTEPALGSGNSGEGAESGRDTAVSLLRAGCRESIPVWQGEERDGEQDRARAAAGRGMETRKSLPRWIWDTPAQSRQRKPPDIWELEEAGRERRTGSWAGRKPHVSR